MPLLDFDDEFSKNQSATLKGELVTATAYLSRVKDAGAGLPGPAAAATTYGTAAAPLAYPERDWASGEIIIPYVAITPAAAFNPTTSGQFDVIAAANVDLTTTVTSVNGDGVSRAPVVISTKTVLVAALTAGTVFSLPALIPGTKRRYLGMKVTCVGGSATTGAIVAGLIDKNARPQGGSSNNAQTNI
jgi:hypothetical protein